LSSGSNTNCTERASGKADMPYFLCTDFLQGQPRSPHLPTHTHIQRERVLLEMEEEQTQQQSVVCEMLKRSGRCVLASSSSSSSLPKTSLALQQGRLPVLGSAIDGGGRVDQRSPHPRHGSTAVVRTGAPSLRGAGVGQRAHPYHRPTWWLSLSSHCPHS